RRARRDRRGGPGDRPSEPDQPEAGAHESRRDLRLEPRARGPERDRHARHPPSPRFRDDALAQVLRLGAHEGPGTAPALQLPAASVDAGAGAPPPDGARLPPGRGLPDAQSDAPEPRRADEAGDAEGARRPAHPSDGWCDEPRRQRPLDAYPPHAGPPRETPP